MKNVKMALIYDFDRTLSPKDMQEFHYIAKLGYANPGDFWAECGKYSEQHNMDSILSYMYLMKEKNPGLSVQELLEEGKYIKLYRGVDSWFERINAYGKAHHIDIEHYIISSGIKKFLEGTSIAKQFRKIYACEYLYDEDGTVLWPARVVNYTTKTQYLFRINKGVLDETNDIDLNRSTPDEDKYIPYDRMIYFGDGLTDVPSMKVVSQFGGNTIAVSSSSKIKTVARELYEDKRATFIVDANYSKGSKVEKVVQDIIDATEAKIKLERYK